MNPVNWNDRRNVTLTNRRPRTDTGLALRHGSFESGRLLSPSQSKICGIAAFYSVEKTALPSTFHDFRTNNQKYDPPNQVTAERLSDQTYKPSHFRLQLDLLAEPLNAPAPRPTTNHRPSNGRLSQSEIDWARVMRDLSRGQDPAEVQARLEQQRQDKHNPADYAARTVNKALAELARRRSLGAQCALDGGLCHD